MRFRNNDGEMPLWVKLLIIVSCLPVLALPFLLRLTRPGFSGTAFLFIYPVYVILAAVCAWRCYDDRSDLTWIIIALMWITHAALWILVLY